MKQLLTMILLGGIALACSGCFTSYVAYKASEREMAIAYAMRTDNTKAIEAVNLGANAVGIGIRLDKWEVLKRNPIRQLGAAALDAALIYGAYELTEGFNFSASSQDSAQRNITVNITGSDNQVTSTSCK